MKIGLVGLRRSGKTTLFNALTGSNHPLQSYNMKVESIEANLKVYDPRVEYLSELYKPKKTTFASIEVMDIIPAITVEDESSNSDFQPDVLRVARNGDALAIVIRNFTNERGDPPEPEKELSKIEETLFLADMIILEKRLEKIVETRKKGNKTENLSLEENVIKKIINLLEEKNSINIESNLLGPSELQIVKSFQLFSLKPVMVILNSDELNFGKSQQLLQKISQKFNVVECAAKFEYELLQLTPEEADLFKKDLGILESTTKQLSRIAFEMLGYISFFTVGEDEVKAWNIRKGSNAVNAAGAIHSDLARGFIAAECFSFEDIKKYGSEKAIKEKGLLRIVGKDYVVQDGDILSIRFNV